MAYLFIKETGLANVGRDSLLWKSSAHTVNTLIWTLRKGFAISLSQVWEAFAIFYLCETLESLTWLFLYLQYTKDFTHLELPPVPTGGQWYEYRVHVWNSLPQTMQIKAGRQKKNLTKTKCLKKKSHCKETKSNWKLAEVLPRNSCLRSLLQQFKGYVGE